MKPDTIVQIIVAGLAAVPMVLALAQWAAFSRAQRAWQEEPGLGAIWRWTTGRVLAYGALVLLSLSAFLGVAYVFWVSFFIPPWQVLWPTAAALLLTGLAGLTSAGALLLKPIRRPIPVFVAGGLNLVLLVWAGTVLMTTPRERGLPAWMLPGVRTGAGRLQKHLFLSVDGVGAVTDIQRGEIRTPRLVELGIAGEYGARFFDIRGKLDASVSFAVPRPDDFRVSSAILRQSGGRPMVFFRQPGAAATYASVVDGNGKDIWRTPYVPVASSVGDLSAGGPPEFIFAAPDRVLEARDFSGGVLWRLAHIGWAFTIAVIRPSDDVPPEILAADNDTGTLLGVDADGHLVFRRKPAMEGFFSEFSTVRWESVRSATCLLVSTNGKLLLLSPRGQRVLAELGPARYVDQVRANTVRLNEGAPPLLAVAGLLEYKGEMGAGFEAVHAELYVFDSKKNLIYDEVLPERVEALGVLPSADGKRESLLVGGENKVWEYSAPGTH